MPTPRPKPEDFSGFANAPVGEDGEHLDFRDVEAYDDQSDAGKVRKASQTTESSVAQFATRDWSTDGSPAAVVERKNDAPEPDLSDDPDIGNDADPDQEPPVPEPDEDEVTPPEGNSEADVPTDPAGGEEAADE